MKLLDDHDSSANVAPAGPTPITDAEVDKLYKQGQNAYAISAAAAAYVRSAYAGENKQEQELAALQGLLGALNATFGVGRVRRFQGSSSDLRFQFWIEGNPSRYILFSIER